MSKLSLLTSAVLVVCAGVLVSLSPAVAATTSATTTATSVKVGLAVIEPVQDKGFNSLAFAGLKKAKKQLHVQTRIITTAQNGNYTPVLQEFVNNHFNFVIAVGALWGNALYTVASANPKVKFAIVDGYPLDSKNRVKHLKNVATLQYKSEQSGYIAGVIAGLMEKNHIGAAKHNSIAALGAIPLPFIIAQMCGYWEGAKSVDKSVKFTDAYVMSFDDPQSAQTIGESQIQKNHADILFGVADASGLGVTTRAAADGHKYAIGFAADQDGLGSYMLTSARGRNQPIRLPHTQELCRRHVPPK